MKSEKGKGVKGKGVRSIDDGRENTPEGKGMKRLEEDDRARMCDCKTIELLKHLVEGPPKPQLPARKNFS